MGREERDRGGEKREIEGEERGREERDRGGGEGERREMGRRGR